MHAIIQSACDTFFNGVIVLNRLRQTMSEKRKKNIYIILFNLFYLNCLILSSSGSHVCLCLLLLGMESCCFVLFFCSVSDASLSLSLSVSFLSREAMAQPSVS